MKKNNMFKETPDGQTYFCDHTTDGSICQKCMGMKNKWEEELRNKWRGHAVVDDAFENADISLNADRIADWWLDKIKETIQKEKEDLTETYRRIPINGNPFFIILIFILFATTSIGLSIGQVIDGNCADPIITRTGNEIIRTCIDFK